VGAIPKILAFAGSTRKESFNKKLVAVAVSGARAAGAQTTLIDLRDYPLPLFDQDLEQEHGLPENAVKLKELMVAHDGLLISSPEYNSSISGVLKNAIDWVSRKGDPDEPGLAAFQGKVAAIMGASPGGLGGMRGLVHLRSILGNIGVLVIPSQKAISKAFSAFAEDGSLVESRQQRAVEALGAEVARIVSKLKD